MGHLHQDEAFPTQAKSAWAVEYIAYLQYGKTPINECTGYEFKQSDGEAPVMLDLWGIWWAPSLPSLSGPLWSGVVTPKRILSMGQIEPFEI